MSITIGNTTITKITFDGIPQGYIGEVDVFGSDPLPDYPVQNLVHYYNLAQDSLDSVSAAHGTDTDVTYSNNAAVFNGTTSKIQLPNIWGSNDSEVSISAMVRADNLNGEYRYISMNQQVGFILLSFDAGNVTRARAYDGNIANIETTSPDPTQWMHVTLTAKENDSSILYINGQQVGSRNINSYVIVGTLGNYLGCSRSGASRFFPGQLKGVGFWNTKLTASEVQAIYTKQNNGENLI